MSSYEFKKKLRNRESGQTLLMFVFFIVLLIVFVGLGIDLGFAYISKAELSKGVDAAALAGILSFPQGTITAQAVAQSTFNANYQKTGRDAGPNTLSITWSTDPSNSNNYINVDASAVINTFFIRVLPSIGGANWDTLTVGAHSQATRSKLIIALVLDRSGSMSCDPPCGSGGGKYLPGAVTDFVSFFDDTNDIMSMVSFSSTANVDFPMNRPFKNQISTDASNLVFTGGTFSPGGLSNAIPQVSNVIIPAGQNVNKVVVFFTDGLANMIQQTLSCGITLNFGGHDNNDNNVSFWDPNTPETSDTQGNPNAAGSCATISDGSNLSCLGCSANQFTAVGGPEQFTRANVTAEAKNQCFQLAETMRQQGMYVFSIGLGDADLTFLQQVANDPSSPTFKSDENVGLALHVQNASDLNPAFRQIAQTILLRLTK